MEYMLVQVKQYFSCLREILQKGCIKYLTQNVDTDNL